MMLNQETVWAAVEPVDMRLGIEGLSLRVQETLGEAPCDGSAYAFRNRRGDRIKLLIWDGAGVWLSCRRLHRGRFVWPDAEAAVFTLDADEWRWLTMGVDWRRLSAKPQAHWRV